jgi:hypothetical protein
MGQLTDRAIASLPKRQLTDFGVQRFLDDLILLIF